MPTLPWCPEHVLVWLPDLPNPVKVTLFGSQAKSGRRGAGFVGVHGRRRGCDTRSTDDAENATLVSLGLRRDHCDKRAFPDWIRGGTYPATRSAEKREKQYSELTEQFVRWACIGIFIYMVSWLRLLLAPGSVSQSTSKSLMTFSIFWRQKGQGSFFFQIFFAHV